MGFSPRTRTLPPLGREEPTKILMRVVLPEPFGPSTPNTSPAPTLRDRPRSASRGPYDLRRPSRLITASDVLLSCLSSAMDPYGRNLYGWPGSYGGLVQRANCPYAEAKPAIPTPMQPTKFRTPVSRAPLLMATAVAGGLAVAAAFVVRQER